MAIQWFPGHMAKARKQVQEKIKQVDLILEVVDARTPESSRNPMLDEIIGEKPRMVILNKQDLADPTLTREWVQYYQDQGFAAIAIDAQHAKRLQQIPQLATKLMAEKIARKKSRGIRNPMIKAMCIGIPNVGKSTVLNRLVHRNIAVTGNKPGVTKNQQWLKASDNFQLLDTPDFVAQVCLTDDRDASGVYRCDCRRSIPRRCGRFIWLNLFYGTLPGRPEKSLPSH